MLRETKLAVLSPSGRIHPLSYLAFIFLLAYSAPFGTLLLGSFLFRLLFWGGIVVGSVLIGRFFQHLVRQWFGNSGPLLQDCLIVALMTVWLTPFMWGYVWLVGQDELMLSLSGTAQYVAVVTAGVCVVRRSIPGLGLRWYFFKETDTAEEPAPAENAAPLPRLARRLPEDFPYPILRLTVDDHLVEVVGQGASHNVRLRFGDAIEEMDPVEGFCTHRSHWVTRDAVAGTERENGQLRLRMTNGDLVPVSRKYRHNLDCLKED
jgi:hypothetical protein